MEPTYIVINQLGQYLNKHKAWISGRDSQLIYRTVHKDEALNQVFEMSSKDIELRARILIAELDEKGQPVVEPGPLSEAEMDKAAGVSHSAEETEIAAEACAETAEKTDENQESVSDEISIPPTLETTSSEPTY